MTERVIDGVLVVYHHFPGDHAPTIMEHVESLERHSRFPVFTVNVDHGFPIVLGKLRFRAVVLHYSLFASDYYMLDHRYRRLLDDHAAALKIAFFQDEMRFCQKRFEFLDRYAIDVVYTLLEPEQHEPVYGVNTKVPEVRTTLTGFVSDDLLDRAGRLAKADHDREIDVGYRARQLPFWMGRGSQEKHEIADRFLERVEGWGLRLDIDTREERRIYGEAWYEFVANCRGMLGVEAGTSVFDLDDSARTRTEALLAVEPDLTFEEVERRVLEDYEDKIPYRTVSPRHFEAAAFRVVQILYRGHYSGVLEPDVHYLALEKDFSNFDRVMARFSDPEERRRIADRAFEDIIASGRWSYASFAQEIDDRLAESGIGSSLEAGAEAEIRRVLRRAARRGRLIAAPRWALRRLRFPGRELVARGYRQFRRARDAS